MSHLKLLYQLEQWEDKVAQNMPNLSRSQAKMLALWSLGVVFTQSCSTSKLALALGLLLEQKPNTVRQRLREFYVEKERKTGDHRQELEVSHCFEPLLRWVLSLWHGDCLTLALDATTLNDRLTVLAVCVIWGKCAIPVAWRILAGNTKSSWKDEWLALFPLLSPAIPQTMKTIVCADRGLYAIWLFQAIQKEGWHPYLRVKKEGTFRQAGGKVFQPLSALCSLGSSQMYRGTAFKTLQLECTLLACWRDGCEDAWFILTDLAPEEANISWYRYRSWIERCFKILKSAGWQWKSSRIKDPARAERTWLALALATMWSLSMGTPEEEIERFDAAWRTDDVVALNASERFHLYSAFEYGRFSILSMIIKGECIRMGEFYPMQWESTQSEELTKEEKKRSSDARKAQKIPPKQRGNTFLIINKGLKYQETYP